MPNAKENSKEKPYVIEDVCRVCYEIIFREFYYGTSYYRDIHSFRLFSLWQNYRRHVFMFPSRGRLNMQLQ